MAIESDSCVFTPFSSAGVLAFLVAFLLASPALGQRRLTETPSLGQPGKWEPYVLPAAHRSAQKNWHSQLTLGVHKPLMNPAVGLLGVSGEVFATADPGVEPGARLLAVSRALGLSAGVDWDARSRTVDGLVSFQTALRRGGIVGRGTMLRADWYPGRADALNLGVFVPFGSPVIGRSRPRDTDVDAPIGAVQIPRSARDDRDDNAVVPPAANAALARLDESAAMLLEYTNLYPERTGTLNYGPSHASVSRAYHQALTEAFRVAVNDSLFGDEVTRRARAGLVDNVLLPFDAQFGQVKEDKSGISPFTNAAHGHFVGWLRDSSRIAPAAQSRVAAVHARWMAVIERAHRILQRQEKDSRLVWMPLQLALDESEYDEQAEVDSLIQRAVGREFSDGNGLAYLETSDIPMEIARSIFAARDHHVLWTHDFTGQRADDKSLDGISYAMVADVYLPAITQAVLRYDSTRVMPIYMILIDEFYYASRNGRLWMDILENPMHARIRLPGANAEREAYLRKRQQELRDAVAKSWRLQQDATANGGQKWLPDVIRVNVNVLLAHDWSFRSHRIVPPFPFVPDNIMRDHRKMAFYDLSDRDPFRGSAFVMGVGIGENYSSPTWEDRAYRVRGPAALEMRDAARRALITSGMKPSDVPSVLQAKADTALDYEPEYVGRAIQLHNEPGFSGPKRSSVARAMLYNLAPAGSVIIVPDPIWVSDTWAAMLAAAAARGCKVYVIAPSATNNPNPHGIIESAENEVLTRLLRSRDRMREPLRVTGGELRIGLFTGTSSYADAEGRRREVREGARRYPWLRELFPFDQQTLALLDREKLQSESDGDVTSALARDETPRAPTLHQKTQLVARPGALAALVRQPGWENILAAAMRAQSRQSASFADQLGFTRPDVDSVAVRRTDAMLRGFETTLPESERKAVSFYFSLGTQNQDPRGLMLDGEATMLVSGFHAAAGVVDLYQLMARTTWVESSADIDRLLPKPGRLTQLLSRWFRAAL